MTEQYEKRLAEIRKWEFYGCNGDDLKFLFERLVEANLELAQEKTWSKKQGVNYAAAMKERDSLQSQLDVAVDALESIVIIAKRRRSSAPELNIASEALAEIAKMRGDK